MARQTVHAQAFFLLGYLCVNHILPGQGFVQAAELLPFPTPERPTLYRQASPSAPPAPDGAMESFRREIGGLSCPEMNGLLSKLQKQQEGATSEEDRQYYGRFVQELTLELATRCAK